MKGRCAQAIEKMICWAIIFITRLRFPPGISIAEIIIHLLLEAMAIWCLGRLG